MTKIPCHWAIVQVSKIDLKSILNYFSLILARGENRQLMKAQCRKHRESLFAPLYLENRSKLKKQLSVGKSSSSTLQQIKYLLPILKLVAMDETSPASTSSLLSAFGLGSQPDERADLAAF